MHNFSSFFPAFNITKEDNYKYVFALADYAHSLGMAIGIKNSNDQPSVILDIMDHFEFAIVEDSFTLNGTDKFLPMLAAGKPIWCVEYDDMVSEDTFNNVYCPLAKQIGFDVILKDHNASGPRRACPA